MKLSVKSDYAARAVLGLARNYPTGAALGVEPQAAAQGVPANYLVQVLIELKAQGIAKSMRGKEGRLFAGATASRNHVRRRAPGGSWADVRLARIERSELRAGIAPRLAAFEIRCGFRSRRNQLSANA